MIDLSCEFAGLALKVFKQARLQPSDRRQLGLEARN